VRSRISFLARLLLLKLLALFTLVTLSLYAPSTTNSLWDGAGGVSAILAKGTENSLQFLGDALSSVNFLVPRKGAVELTFRYIAMDKVMLFIGITVALYVSWLVLIGLAGTMRRKPARLHTVGGKSPQAR
jgi:hypothetical protein